MTYEPEEEIPTSLWYRLTPTARKYLVAFAKHLGAGLTGKAEFECRGGGIRDAVVTTRKSVLDGPDNDR